ncbi:TIGR04283 family arsenosugar biosynthesis glycosyltransferase [Deltaproteobacteria bacterium]|nr:TIGR04283 family arsenosugar biosynthesis glycosyltransferase [Deltaproteobacteria bacterium]
MSPFNNHSNKNSFPDRIIIFGRYPVPGKSKTRLIPKLGPAGAADLYRILMEKTFNTVKESASESPFGIEVNFEEGSRQKMRNWLGSVPFLSSQHPGDLGQRMYMAFREAFRIGCRKVLLIGTDIPEISKELLKEAFDELNNNDIVLGPSTDGGYWLIGLKRPINLFQGVQWGGETVLNQTIALAKKDGLGLHLLAPLTDIDRIEDIMSLLPEKDWNAPYLSIIIPAMNEQSNISATIHSARDRDAEIIVVDGGSTDETREEAILLGARVLSGTPGRALQQNLGASVSRGKTLLFLHSDTLLPKSYMNLIFETLMDPGVAAGAFRFKTDHNSPSMKIIELAANIRSQYLNLPYGDQGLFLKKTVFDTVGGFPDVPIAEDLYLVRRLARTGRIRIAKDYVITSARRWQRLGIFRTTLINYLILAGCIAGVSPQRLASLYPIPRKKRSSVPV